MLGDETGQLMLECRSGRVGLGLKTPTASIGMVAGGAPATTFLRMKSRDGDASIQASTQATDITLTMGKRKKTITP